MKNMSSDPPHLHPIYCQSVAITPPPGKFLSHFLIQNPIYNPRAIKILRTGLQSAVGLQSAISIKTYDKITKRNSLEIDTIEKLVFWESCCKLA